MLAFVSIFLGLVVGPQLVELAVGDAVERVVIQVDDEVCAELEEPPWRVACDLGAELRPRRLVALGMDSDGQVLARAEQWLNVFRESAEAKFVLELDEAGSASRARLVWSSSTSELPLDARIELDGQPLLVEDPASFSLPRYNPRQLHFLRADLSFPGDVHVTAETTFGGVYSADSSLALTGVLYSWDKKKPPRVDELAARDRAGRDLEIVAVEKPPAEVFVVRDGGARDELEKLAGGTGYRRVGFGTDVAGARSGTERLMTLIPQRSGESLRFFWPHRILRQRDSGPPIALFPRTASQGEASGGYYWQLRTSQWAPYERGEQKLAEALAVAARSASGSKRRRALVLLLADAAPDSSQYPARQVRDYVDRMGEPLFVWRFGEEADASSTTWSSDEWITSMADLNTAARSLQRSLDRQFLVWVAGRHLPGDVEVRAEGPR